MITIYVYSFNLQRQAKSVVKMQLQLINWSYSKFDTDPYAHDVGNALREYVIYLLGPC